MTQTTHCQRVLDVLADGRRHSVPEIHRRAGTMRLNSRVAELRKRGHDIVCDRIPGRKGAASYGYTWVDAPPQPAQAEAQLRLDSDEIAPREEAQRYRIYRVVGIGDPELVATVASPEAVGVALCTLGAEGEFEDACVGIMIFATTSSYNCSGTPILKRCRSPFVS